METLQADVKQLSLQAESLLHEQDELVWRGWTEGRPVDIAKTYQGHEALFTVASIKKLERLQKLTLEPRELRALGHLHTYFVGEYLASALAEASEAVANLEASMTFTVEGKEIRFRELDRLLANERSTARRRALYDAATPSVQRLAQSVRRKEEKVQSVLAELGYPSYDAFGAELRQVHLERLGLVADLLLQATQTPYVTVMATLSERELGLPLEKLRRADLPRLFRRSAVDKSFPKETVLPRALDTLKGLGVEPSTLKNYRLEARELPNKNPRPLTLAVAVPEDVRTSLMPSGGLRDQALTLHELGHAMVYVYSKETRFELAKLGGGAVPEAFGDLFEALVEDPIWLADFAKLGGEKGEGQLWASAAYRLYQVRRAAGHVLYELQRRKGDGPPRALYSAVMARTYGIPMTPDDAEREEADQEDFYESADTLQAWLLASQLQSQLQSRFGTAWWKDVKAGDFLRYLWAKGNSLTAREVARMSGDEGLKPDALLQRLGTTLKVSIPLPTLPREVPDAAAEGAAPPP